MENFENGNAIFGTDYKDGGINLFTKVTKPSYDVALDLMRTIENPQVSLDFWARGNYTRRLIYNLNNEVQPLVIPVRNIGEMSWAYKRLALIDIPVEFIVIENLSKPSKVLHLCPTDINFDSGWGYIGALGSVKKIKDREVFPIIGNARLLPEYFARWIIDEVPQEFVDGKVFISPANLVGIDNKQYHNGIRILSNIYNGGTVEENELTAENILKLDIPFLDNISIAKQRKLLKNYEPELKQFRMAFRELISSNFDSQKDTNYYIEKLNYEVSEIRHAKKNQGFRMAIKKNNGILTILTATLPLADVVTQGVNSMSSLLNFTSVGALCGAASIFSQIWKQYKDSKTIVKKNPFSMFWHLGISKPNIRNKHLVSRIKVPKDRIIDLNVDGSFHWLTPPQNGLGFLGVKK